MLTNRILTISRHIRKIHTTKINEAPPPKLLEKYRRFQTDDGIPVYLKGGLIDKLLFQFTVGLCIVGLADGLYTIFTMARPKKHK